MPVIFTFGVPNVFNFTFRAGTTLPGLADGTVNGESNSGHTQDCEVKVEVEAIKTTSLPSHGIESQSPSPCGSLSKFPLEVRNMIYSNIMKYRKDILRPHRFLGSQPSILVKDSKHIQVIDAALLRTCKAIYHEAIQILYGGNCFQFNKPSDIKDFAHFGLGNIPFGFYGTSSKPSSPINNATYGRLTMIRLMNLRLGCKNTEDSLTKVWSFWSGFFNPPEKQDQLVEFPALERLVLDFVEWDLHKGEASEIRVKPFLQKLRPTGGLKHLTLIGVSHEQNLRDFKHGFVRQGGTFRPAPRSVTTIADTIVSHDDLPKVSMFVRAIVEKDGASRTALRNKKRASTSNST